MVQKVNLGGSVQNTKSNERDAKLKEYNELKRKQLRQPKLSEAEQKRLEALEKELKARNIINDSGEKRSESSNIWDLGKRELTYEEYEMGEAMRLLNESGQKQKEKMSNILNGIKEVFNNQDE